MESFQREDLTFDVLDSGPADGETIVLLHGFPESSASWSAVTPRLVDAGFRVLAPDQRGYSPGARPLSRRSYRLDTLAEDVIALLDAAGVERAHVVGHDWGGSVAWALGMWHPERLASLTTLSTPHPAAFKRAMRTSSQLLRSWYMIAWQVPAVPEWLVAPSTPRGQQRLSRGLERSGLPADRARFYAERLAAPGALTGGLNWYRGIVFTRSGKPPRAVSVPTLYIYGPEDPFLGKLAVDLTQPWVTGFYQLEILPGAGHWLPECNPEPVAALILAHASRQHR
jgi:pimeloyl-ACP methyl ester carboxylesterase